MSCGQSKEKEKKCGKEICDFFKKKFANKVEILFAENLYTSAGLTDIIYKNLRECDAVIAVLHRREKINQKEFISSLFVNQELAIASFLEKKFFLVYSEPKIKLEGVFKYLMNRTIEFSTPENIIDNLNPQIDEWLSIWKPPEPILRFNEPKIIKMVERSTKFSEIEIEIAIDNIATWNITDFQFGIIVPSEIRFIYSIKDGDFIEFKPTNERLTGGLLKYFFTDNDESMYVSKYIGVLPSLYTFNMSFRLQLLKNLKLFQIGFYYFAKGIEIEILSGRINIKSFKEADIDINRGLNKYKIFQSE